MRLKEGVKRGIQLFAGNDISVFAGYATLFIVTAFFPFTMLIIAIINMLPGISAGDVEDVLLRVLPDLPAVKELVGAIVANLKNQASGLLASVAAAATLWSASKGVFAIQKGLRHMDEEDGSAEEEDSETRKKVKGVGIMILKRLGFTLALVILIPGAVFTVVCWGAFTELFSYFIPKFFNASLYGSLASPFLLFLWVWIMVIILFAGEILNRVLGKGRQSP